MGTIKDKAAIVGIGATDFSKNSGRSELRLAAEAASAAIADAGLRPSDIDGIATYTMDNNLESEVARAIGAGELSFFSKIGYGGGGACGPIQQAAMAIATGAATAVLCYRAMNERSEYRFGTPANQTSATSETALFAYHNFHGLFTPAAFMATAMRRYMHETGATSEDFATVAITARRHASTNPKAFFYGKPLTFDAYMAARMIADPFRLFDCCQESDGGVAVVLTAADRARDLRHRPVLVRAAAQASTRGMTPISSFYHGDIYPYAEVRMLAEQMYRNAGLGPDDIDVAILYDHFGPTVLPALEAFGFCARGEAKDFIKGGNIGLGGRLPLNTHGGQVGEAYIHGMNGVAEAVRQLRGDAVNQVGGARHAIVTAGSGLPTSGLILGTD